MHSLAVSPGSRNAIAIWLALCMFMVAAMVVVGGMTRLTESGLSIVEWKPIAGILPPLSETSWQTEFEQYKTSPEYQKINRGMSLDEFKQIFWLEYLHRLLGRLIGVVFFVPLAFFYLTKRLPPSISLKLLGIFLLGGIQGIVGWYMVKSGLIDDPRVSPYRLALHLSLAFLIFALLQRVLMRVLWSDFNPTISTSSPAIHQHSCILLGLTSLQIILGALVAGNDAGLTYNTFPLMDGRFVPAGLWLLDPWYRNFFENVTMVQFCHRMTAYVLLIFTLFFWFYGRRYATQPQALKTGFLLLPLLLLAQVALGILTLVHVVPISLASAHQLLALVLFAVIIMIQFGLERAR